MSMQEDYERMSRSDRREAERLPSVEPVNYRGKALRGPVGIRYGKTQVKNAIPDQNAVMAALNLIPVENGGNRKPDDALQTWWPLAIEGKCHQLLYERILQFQKINKTTADGVVDPNGGAYQGMLRMAYPSIPRLVEKNAPREQAIEALPKAKGWVAAALGYLSQYIAALTTGTAFNHIPIETHFHMAKIPAADRPTFASRIITPYFQILRFLAPENIEAVSVDDLLKRSRCFGDTAAAFCGTTTKIMVSPTFVGLGINCRAAILIHEASHHFGAGHINGERGAAYDNATPQQAITSAYVFPNFAEHVVPPYVDQRFGLARPKV